jgi:hypothetical protein
MMQQFYLLPGIRGRTLKIPIVLDLNALPLRKNCVQPRFKAFLSFGP